MCFNLVFVILYISHKSNVPLSQKYCQVFVLKDQIFALSFKWSVKKQIEIASKYFFLLFIKLGILFSISGSLEYLTVLFLYLDYRDWGVEVFYHRFHRS